MLKEGAPVRKALLISFALTGLGPVLVAGCAGKSTTGTPVAKKSSFSEWPGVSTVAGMFKKDPKKPVAAPFSMGDEGISLTGKKTKPTPELMVAWAKMQEHAGKLDDAETNYKEALKIAPNHLPALVGYAHLLDRQNKMEEATALYKQAIDKHPREASAHNDLGLCYARRGMMTESIVSLSKAVELQPNKKLYRNNIATVLVEQNRATEALDHLAAGEQPAVANFNLACLLHQKGKTSQAAIYFARAAEIDPSLVAAREWADKLAATNASPRLTSVRPIDSGSIYDGSRNTVDANRTINTVPAAAASQYGYQPSWPARASVDNSSWNKSSNERGSSYAGDMPPTPDNTAASNYATRTSAVDELPPVDSTPLPRY